MKLCYIAGVTVPSRVAQSIQVMKMAQAFARTGQKVTLILPSVPGQDIDIYSYYGVEPIFDIKRVPRHIIKGGLLLWGFRAALVARRENPDLVYVRQVHSSVFASLLGLPVLVERHGPLWGTKKTLFSFLVRRRNFKRLVTNSHRLAEMLKEEYGLADWQVLGAPNGAEDPGSVDPCDLGDGNHLRVGYVGHLYHGRGVDLILETARACPWADFHIIGGREKDISRAKSRGSDLSNVVFHGFVTPGEVESYRQACDVLLAPYQWVVHGNKPTDQVEYMSPLKLFEYMASGRAILCSDIPVLHEILTPDETGIFCEPDDPDDWIAALERLRDDPALRHRLGRNARETFLNEFTRTARAERVLAGLGETRRRHRSASVTLRSQDSLISRST